MRILFDQGVPAGLRRYLSEHDVRTAHEEGWSELANGDLLDAVTLAGFDIFVTTDQNLRYQQNLAARTIAVFVLMTTAWPRLLPLADSVSAKISQLRKGDYEEYSIP